MTELQKNLEQLLTRLDHMGLRVEQAVSRALQAARTGDRAMAEQIREQDSIIDIQEVAIEQECIRLLALHQPAASDLRKICFVIKVNTDLERIADMGAAICKRVSYLVDEAIALVDYPGYLHLQDAVIDVVAETVGMLNSLNVASARAVMAAHRAANLAYKAFVRGMLSRERRHARGADTAVTLSLLARSMERVGDLCTNIAEDVVFLCTGEIVRHTDALEASPLGESSS